MSSERRIPPWLRTACRFTPEVRRTKVTLRGLNLHTVCEEANCPNIGECFSRATATFMILGDICTRNCAFCGCEKGKPRALDPNEPANVAEATRTLGLKHCVITSVTRDDLDDGGARQFAETIRAVKMLNPGTTIEVLTPDFGGNASSLETVLEAGPEVFNHNIETVPRLYSEIRPGAGYTASIELLRLAKNIAPQVITKSGIMVGLSETLREVEGVLSDLATARVDAVTIGQYMQPSRDNVAVSEYYEPGVFAEMAELGESLGIGRVLAAPLVRSSYKAAELIRYFHG
ncbi:MAG: lipoyl synthase [Candidatus Coatesbacteria bacterium]|nr:lipoyl synthase [Candidatus Coatesbacteria bacterium]